MKKMSFIKKVLIFIIGIITAIYGIYEKNSTTSSTGTEGIVAESPEEIEKILARVPKPIGSFSTAKKKLYNEVYKGHQRTFYCDCKFTRTGKVQLGTCDVTPRKNERRAKQLEAEHVVPAYHMGLNRACWTQGAKVCADSKGEKYKGRKCCEKSDKVFKVAHNDLHNLYPAVGEVNGDRSNYKFGMITGEKRAYGQCDFEVDKDAKRAEPPENVKGNIARTYFYMSKTYNFPMSKQQRQLFEAWSKSDPVDDWERERNQRIKKIQGNANPYIQ